MVLVICSSVDRAFAYGAMGRRVDPALWTHGAYSRSSQCSTTGATKVVVCTILSLFERFFIMSEARIYNFFVECVVT